MPVNNPEGSVRSVASGEKDLSEREMFRRARFIGEPAPDHKIPEDPMDPVDAKYLIEEELFLEAIPRGTSPPSSPPGWARTSRS
jgi:hypothetical protein